MLVVAGPAAAQHKPKRAKHKRVTHSGTLVSRTAQSVTVKRGDKVLTRQRSTVHFAPPQQAAAIIPVH